VGERLKFKEEAKMSRGNKKRKAKGIPLKYKSPNVNYSAVDFAIEVDGNYYDHGRKIYKSEVEKYKSLFLSFVADRKERNEEFRHIEAVRHANNLM
jgi:hypothetical protein